MHVCGIEYPGSPFTIGLLDEWAAQANPFVYVRDGYAKDASKPGPVDSAYLI